MNIKAKRRIGPTGSKNSGMGRRVYFSFVVLSFLGSFAAAQNDVVTVRCATPRFNCSDLTYRVDVELQAGVPARQLFGLNLRFFYDASMLEFVSFEHFAAGYGLLGETTKIKASPASGPMLFGFSGSAEYVNGAIQLLNTAAPPLYMATGGWTKLVTLCFAVQDAVEPGSFYPSIVWDLKADPAEGAFLPGSNGVVMTLVSVEPGVSAEAEERVVQLNWVYGNQDGKPYGVPMAEIGVDAECCSHDEACDDGDPCTSDRCDPDTGTCVHVAVDCGEDAP